MEFNGSDIENIKINEKNSNKSKNEDIQSNEKENLKQAFKDKDQKEVKEEHELNLDSDKLKKDLVKILDVSIEDIEID
ncbi:hypothetical protein SDC9_152723 [bioreactor metagenome]|uniref:Uncharacterized protein n=1 Tax=bioreactor metagenome TaxID=1076179 RepID=A0A645EW65_9ZZZZ